MIYDSELKKASEIKQIQLQKLDTFKIDQSEFKVRCPACEIVVQAKHSKALPCLQTLYRHIKQCHNFSQIVHPSKIQVFEILESLSIANKLGMIVK